MGKVVFIITTANGRSLDRGTGSRGGRSAWARLLSSCFLPGSTLCPLLLEASRGRSGLSRDTFHFGGGGGLRAVTRRAAHPSQAVRRRRSSAPRPHACQQGRARPPRGGSLRREPRPPGLTAPAGSNGSRGLRARQPTAAPVGGRHGPRCPSRAGAGRRAPWRRQRVWGAGAGGYPQPARRCRVYGLSCWPGPVLRHLWEIKDIFTIFIYLFLSLPLHSPEP